MSTYNYIVTAQKPTVVTHSVTGNFTAPDHLNLILAKCNRLEIHRLTPEGLEPVLDVPIYGRICTLDLYRPRSEKQDLLFICTERFQFCVLAYDPTTGEIVTRAQGDVKYKIGKPAEGQLGIIDPRCRCIGLHLYDGIFQVIPITNQGKLYQEAFILRLMEMQVVSMCFLHGYQKPVILVLAQDAYENRNLKTYEVQIEKRTLEEGPWVVSKAEKNAAMLIPVPEPLNGALVVGTSTVTYYNRDVAKSASFRPVQMTAWGRVDDTRYLLGDALGMLYVVVIKHNGKGTVVGVHVEPLGVTSCASAISYLDNGFVFVGSTYGDSVMVHLNTEKDQNGSFIEVLETYPNLGPIVDMSVMDLDRQGQGQLVSCSGAYKDSSLRVIRNGIAINESASVDLPGMKGIWSLRESFDSVYDKFLVETFVSETRILTITDDVLGETEIAGFDSGSHTLYCGNIRPNVFVQITADAVRIISAESLALVSKWVPPSAKINLGHANDSQILVAMGGKHLVLLGVDHSGQLKELASSALEQEISCLCISSADIAEDGNCYAAVGLWHDWSVRILQLPSLREVAREKEAIGDIISRTVTFAKFGTVSYVLVGLGDGHLISLNLEFKQNAVSIIGKKKISLGTQPIVLSPFYSHRKQEAVSSKEEAKDEIQSVLHVFACCDRPVIIYSSPRGDGKLLYSNVNQKDVNYMAPFNAEVFPNCLALATEEKLVIGDIFEEIQRLHIRSVPLKEFVRRIAHQPSTGTIAVGFQGSEEKLNSSMSDADEGVSHVRLYDEQALEVTSSFSLKPNEDLLSLLNVRLDLHTSVKDESSRPTRMDTDNSSSKREAKDEVSDMEVDDVKVPASSSADTAYVSAEEEKGEYFVAGTAFAIPSEPEPTQGRILVFQVVDRKLVLLSETATNGAVFALAELDGKLVATVNSKVQLYKWTLAPLASNPSGRKLALQCDHHGHVLVLKIHTHGNFILAADLVRSMTLLTYKPTTGTIEEIARDFNSNWMTASEMLDSDHYIGADNAFNLFTVARNNNAVTEEDRARLETVGRYHLGEFVNVIRAGSLVMNTLESDNSVVPSHVLGTVNGSIYVLAPLNKQQFTFLSSLEAALENIIKGVGGFSHKEFRTFIADQRIEERLNFVDGDLIECVLDLSPDKLEQVAQVVGVAVPELLRRIEELSRIH